MPHTIDLLETIEEANVMERTSLIAEFVRQIIVALHPDY